MQYTDKSRVLNTLRGRKKGMTAQELCDKLNIPSRNSVYAVISSLRAAGHPITGARKGTSGLTRYSYA
jgi:predicted DNA-binding transcriptional regulator YafY